METKMQGGFNVDPYHGNKDGLGALNDFYDQRYKKDAYDLTEISDDESKYIRQMIHSARNSKADDIVRKQVITLIDYGCGDGRLHPLYEDISQELLDWNCLLRIIAIDPSQAGLSVYFNKCIQSGYNTKQDGRDGKLCEIGEKADIKVVSKRNIEVYFFNSDTGILERFKIFDSLVDLLVSVAVICHILGSNNRRNMLQAFKMASPSLFISQPTLEDFSSIQNKFLEMRSEKKLALNSVNQLLTSDGDVSRLKRKISDLDEVLKEAQEDGEIYYSAGWVRNLGEKLPECKDVQLPYFGTTVALSRKAVAEAGYKYVTSVRGALGKHRRWIITLASDLFETNPAAIESGQESQTTMGVIKKILFRGNILGQPRHRNLFLDMEENIHIHYRDLRIELSRGEFEEISNTFIKQAGELLAIIHEKNYQDGKLPNANQDDVRIWTESRLKHDVRYHPQRFSLEECGDGYHFHYRNYKLLIDKAEFKQIVQLFKSIDLDAAYAATYDDVLELLEANEIDFTLDTGNVPGELLAISVAQHHLPKLRETFNYIGFTQETHGAALHYLGPQLKVAAKIDKLRTALNYRRMRGFNQTGRLVDFLLRNSAGLDTNELNRIKCQVLDLYFALNAGKKLNVETDHQLWLYAPENNQVIFPYSTTSRGGKDEAETLYKAWSGLLARLQLGFVKPAKENFAASVQSALQQQVAEAIRREVAAFIAVDRIYLMGSALRSDMGRYQVPFVHGKMAKLGSDVDILVEINPSRETDIPGHWQLINQEASNHCAIYHVSQIPIPGGLGEWSEFHPNIKFTQHLIDAYVFFPSHGYRDEKDAFLHKFSAKLIYDRTRDGYVSRGGEEERIVGRLKYLHDFPQVMVERMKVSTENALYKVFTGEHDYILKLFKASGNYSSKRIAEHTAYEERLITLLKGRGVSTAGVIPTRLEENATIEGFPALLFERISGEVQNRPEYPLDRICHALAKIHRVQMDNPLDLAENFTFDEICMMWLPQFHNYYNNPSLNPEITNAFAGLSPLVERCNPGAYRAPLYARSAAVHNHGDVKPKNVIVGEDGEAWFFDFNNAFFGPRMADILDGAFEFSLAEKYIDMADFARFDEFIEHYAASNPLSTEELKDLPKWIELIGVIKFTKEIRVLLERPGDQLRMKRALSIAEFVLSRPRATGPKSMAAAT